MTENKRYSFNWERGHPNFWDNYCDLADCYLTYEDVVNRLNGLDGTIKDLSDDYQRLMKENKELKQQLSDIDKLINDLGSEEMCRQYDEIIGDVE